MSLSHRRIVCNPQSYYPIGLMLTPDSRQKGHRIRMGTASSARWREVVQVLAGRDDIATVSPDLRTEERGGDRGGDRRRQGGNWIHGRNPRGEMKPSFG